MRRYLLHGLAMVALAALAPGCAENDDIYANTRTTNTNPLMRFLLWQMPYHVAHHAYPGIPFHALKDANALLHGASRHEARGYLAFHSGWWRAIGRPSST